MDAKNPCFPHWREHWGASDAGCALAFMSDRQCWGGHAPSVDITSQVTAHALPGNLGFYDLSSTLLGVWIVNTPMYTC